MRPVEGPSPKPRSDWQNQAECAGADPAWFEPYAPAAEADPDKQERTAIALGYCAACPVMFECRFVADAAMDYPAVGFLGGQYRSRAYAEAQREDAVARRAMDREMIAVNARRKHAPQRDLAKSRKVKGQTWTREQLDARDLDILARIRRGETYASIGKVYGIGKHAVYQINHKYAQIAEAS